MPASWALATTASGLARSTERNASLQSAPALTSTSPACWKRTALQDSVCTGCEETAPTAWSLNRNVSTAPVMTPAATSDRLGCHATSNGCSERHALRASGDFMAHGDARWKGGGVTAMRDCPRSRHS